MLVVGAGLAWKFGYGGRLLNLISPVYWVRRIRGVDLYVASTRFLNHGNPRLKEVALTIDDGPHMPTGGQILDILKEYDVKATFFIVGMRAKQQPELLKRMMAEGHEVANHTQNHYRLTTLRPDQMRREINDCDINFCRVTGRHLNLLRPPGVRYNDSVLKVADDLGYTIVGWNCGAKDFDEVTPDFILDRVLNRVENGSIILLHDDLPSTVVALPRVLAELKRSGYRFVTVSELLAHLPNPVIVQSNPDSEGKVSAAAQAGNSARFAKRELAGAANP